MKIYFAGSIRGSRQDAAIYRQLIEELKTYGEVLTEHIGSSKISNEPTDHEIHKQDMQWLAEADILVGEVTAPSHGVGYEVGRAVAMKKKVVCLYQKTNNKPISAMIKGSPAVECYAYTDIDGAKTILDRIFSDMT